MSTRTASALQHQPQLSPKIDFSQLRPGDIIATASPSENSRAIQWATNSPYSHAILYRGGGQAVDAMPGRGVTVEPLTLKLSGSNISTVFRHRTATRSQCEQAAVWAMRQAGKPYDTVGAARVGLQTGARTRPFQFTNPGGLMVIVHEGRAALSQEGHDESFFCSELIVRAFEVVGAPIVSKPAHLTGPGTFEHTAALVRLGDLA